MVFISVMPRVLHGSKGSVGDDGTDSSSFVFTFDSDWLVSFGDILWTTKESSHEFQINIVESNKIIKSKFRKKL